MLDGMDAHPVKFDLIGPMRTAWQSLTTGSGRIRTVLVHMDRNAVGGIEAVGEDLELVRSITNDIVSDTAPGTDWGATGLPALEADETTQAIEDSTAASIIAFVLVTLMMAARLPAHHPAAARRRLAAGGHGLEFRMGGPVGGPPATAVGRLLGDSHRPGHRLSCFTCWPRLRVVHTEYDSLPDAMARSFRDAGPGLITGATLTTALAFAATVVDRLQGVVAEMGVIAGGGVILLLVAMLCVFPAALAIERTLATAHRAGSQLGRPLTLLTSATRLGRSIGAARPGRAPASWSSPHCWFHAAASRTTRTS